MKQKRIIRIVIADNHALLRQMIVRSLSQNGNLLKFVGEVGTASAVPRTCVKLEPDLLLVSMMVLHRDGYGAIVEVRKRNPQLNILVYSSARADEREIARVIKIGINGHIGWQSDVSELLEAIQKTGRGENYFCKASMRLLSEMARGKHSALTGKSAPSPREIEILRLIANGRTSKEIARLLGLSIATVDTHRRNLMAKVRAHNAAEVIRFGRDNGLLEASSLS